MKYEQCYNKMDASSILEQVRIHRLHAKIHAWIDYCTPRNIDRNFDAFDGFQLDSELPIKSFKGITVLTGAW